jgi:HPt (histidine-containing phosphotransfer) domain-containing protein
MYVQLAPKALAEMAIAVLDGNVEALRASAHAFNGSSRTVGAERIAAVCDAIEAAAVGKDFAEADRRLAQLRQETSYFADELHTITPTTTTKDTVEPERREHGRRKRSKTAQEKAA